MTAAEWLDLALGSLQLLLAAVVLKHLRRFGRAFPWLVALMLFFALRGLQRLQSAFTDTTQEALGLVADGVLLAVLVLLLVGLRKTVRGLEFALDEADARMEAYGRALHDYRALARHRIANPVTVIRAGLTTLRELEPSPAERAAILDAVEQAALELEHVDLEPVVLRPEERGLEPSPGAVQAQLRDARP